jgi:tetratricopeptide (TPR) repeat protein
MKCSMYYYIILVLVIKLQAGMPTNTDSLLVQSIHSLNEAIDAWNEGAMLSARAQIERLLKIDSTSFLCHYYIAYANYRLASFYHAQQDNDKVDKVADDAIDHLQKALDLNSEFADGYAMLSSMYGEKIAVSPIKSVYYGPKAGAAMNKALEIEPNNPRAYLMDGISKYYTPKLFGGGIENAREALQEAVKFFKTYKSKSEFYPGWGERETYAWLGIIAKENDDFEQARKYYEQALAIDSNYGWVIYSLLPQLEKAAAKTEE